MSLDYVEEVLAWRYDASDLGADALRSMVREQIIEVLEFDRDLAQPFRRFA